MVAFLGNRQHLRLQLLPTVAGHHAAAVAKDGQQPERDQRGHVEQGRQSDEFLLLLHHGTIDLIADLLVQGVGEGPDVVVQVAAGARPHQIPRLSTIAAAGGVDDRPGALPTPDRGRAARLPQQL